MKTYDFKVGDVVADSRFGSHWKVLSVTPDKERMELQLNKPGGPFLTAHEETCGWDFTLVPDEKPFVEEKPAKNRMKLPNGNYMVATRNEDTPYSFEMFIDIEDADGKYLRPVAIVRPSYVSLGSDEAKAFDLRNWEGDVNAIVKGRFEVLFPDDDHGEDFERFSFPGNPGRFEWTPYTTLRTVAETGMVPSNVQSCEMCYIPLYDGYGLCAVAKENDREVYVGIEHGIYWHQNLCRFRCLFQAKSHIFCEPFIEWLRGYESNRVKAIPAVAPEE